MNNAKLNSNVAGDPVKPSPAKSKLVQRSPTLFLEKKDCLFSAPLRFLRGLLFKESVFIRVHPWLETPTLLFIFNAFQRLSKQFKAFLREKRFFFMNLTPSSPSPIFRLFLDFFIQISPPWCLSIETVNN